MTAVETLQPAIIYLGAGLAAALASRAVRLSPIVGYLVAGLVIGPSGFGGEGLELQGLGPAGCGQQRRGEKTAQAGGAGGCKRGGGKWCHGVAGLGWNGWVKAQQEDGNRCRGQQEAGPASTGRNRIGSRPCLASRGSRLKSYTDGACHRAGSVFTPAARRSSGRPASRCARVGSSCGNADGAAAAGS